jgi:predicted  nucleic acid-binding Zn-ribbon protein
MNLYKELSELEDMKEKSKSQADEILDHYFTDPKKAKKLLIELNSIEKELEELEEEFKKLQNEIS